MGYGREPSRFILLAAIYIFALHIVILLVLAMVGVPAAPVLRNAHVGIIRPYPHPNQSPHGCRALIAAKERAKEILKW
ncbi:MAG: hypothetical protein D8M54_01890 [Chloroflexi bacterium]|nr:hypothetical protein [Chloroflexota bacterium]